VKIKIGDWFNLLLGGTLLLGGCTEDAETEPLLGEFVIGTQLVTPDSTQSFVVFADDIEAPGQLTLDDSVEAGSAGGVFSPGDGTGVFFTAESGGTLQRWRPGSTDSGDPTVVRDGTVSFAAYGLTSFFPTASHIQFIDETKAYVMNSPMGEIILWDPTNLQVRGVIQIPGLVTQINGVPGSFSFSGVRSGTRLMFTYNYFGDSGSFTRESYLVVIDTTTDTAQSAHTTSCGDLNYGMAAANGDVYWASGFFNASIHRLAPDLAPAPCLLLVPNGTATFVDTAVTLTALTGGRPAGNIVPAGPNRGLMRVYHEEVLPITSDMDVNTLVGSPAWRWWSLDLGTMQAAELPNSTSGRGQTIHYDVAGEPYVINLAADYSSTTIERVVPEGAPVPGLTVAGVARFGIVKL